MHEEMLYELKEKLMKELAEYSQNGKFSKEDVESLKYIASAIDHICNIVERMEEEQEYSGRGSYDNGNQGDSMGGSGGYSRNRGYYRGGRYPREGGSYYGSSYARGRGQNARRDSMGRYSRDGQTEQMVEQLRELMQDAPNDQIRQQMQQLAQQLEQM